MPNKMGEYYEEDFHGNLGYAIEKTCDDMEPVLKPQSAIENSMNNLGRTPIVIENSVNNLEHAPVVSTVYVAPDFNNAVYADVNDTGMGQDNSQIKSYQRVRSNYGGMATSVSTYEPERVSTPVKNISSGEIVSDSSVNSMVGSAQTLILICTAILVVMVVFVSLIVMKYVGL